MINPKEKMLDYLKSQAVPFSAADETDIVAVAMAFGEEIQKHGDPAMAIYALKQQLAECQTMRGASVLVPQAELEAMKKDAARYHHVLKLLCTDNDKAVVDTFVQMPFEGDYPTPDEFTAAIDQAMKEE